MDIAVLTAFLAPFLPFLLKLGTKASESVATKVGEDAWKKAKEIWTQLGPKVEAKEAAKEAVTDVANNPEDEDLQAVLRVQLKKLIEPDQELAAAIEKILNEKAADGTPGMQIVQNVTGDRNQLQGQISGKNVFGNVQGNVTID
jgi:hypothetical protein